MNKKIVILGDSLTFGYLATKNKKMLDIDNWPKKLKDLLDNYYYKLGIIKIQVYARPGRTIVKPLINFGFLQDNGLDNLIFLYKKSHPINLFIIFLGTNDYFYYKYYAKLKKLKNYPIETKIVNSLKKIIDKMKKLHKINKEDKEYKVLIICPPKILTLNKGELLTSLPCIYEKYFTKLNIPVVNLQLSANPRSEDNIKYDGIHYTPTETTAVAQSIFNVILKKDLLKLN